MSVTIEDDPTALAMPSVQAMQAAVPDVLNSISTRDCNIAIWRRNSATDCSAPLSGTPEDIRFDTRRADLAPRFGAALSGHGFGASHLHRALADDVALLADLFCSALEIEELELRLEVVTTDSCGKFHADFVVGRLITTYVGPGAQWLSQDDAERARADHELHRINQLATCDVGIFKGRLATDHPAIHCSPPIATSAGTRLLLVLNRTERP